MRYKNGPKLNFFLMPITFIIHHQKFDCNKWQFFLLWALYVKSRTPNPCIAFRRSQHSVRRHVICATSRRADSTIPKKRIGHRVLFFHVYDFQCFLIQFWRFTFLFIVILWKCCSFSFDWYVFCSTKLKIVCVNRVRTYGVLSSKNPKLDSFLLSNPPSSW